MADASRKLCPGRQHTCGSPLAPQGASGKKRRHKEKGARDIRKNANEDVVFRIHDRGC